MIGSTGDGLNDEDGANRFRTGHSFQRRRPLREIGVGLYIPRGTDDLESLLNKDIDEADANTRIDFDVAFTRWRCNVCNYDVLRVEGSKYLLRGDVRLTRFVDGGKPAQHAATGVIQDFRGEHDKGRMLICDV